MGRPERHDADYFPFYVKDGKTLFILESKYGLQGIGFFTNLMRFLTRQTDHHICIKDESDRLYFFAQIRCPEDVGTDMLNLMAKTGKIDPDLWEKSQVIVSPDLLDSLKEAYKNRNNPIIEVDIIRVSYQVNEVSSPLNPITSPDKPQRKGKERKGKEIAPFVLPEWIPQDIWNAYLETRTKKRAAKTDNALWLVIRELEKIKRTHNHDPVEVLKKSIRSGWTDVYPLKEGNGNGGNQQRDFRGKQAFTQDARRDGGGGSGTPPEYIPDVPPDIADDEREAQAARVREFIRKI
jgi:hypothetical protein